MITVYRAVVAVIGAAGNALALVFAAVAASPVVVLLVAFALWVGLLCLREARHPCP